MLAAAQLTVLMFNSEDTLFAYLPKLPDGIRCDGARGMSLWCLGELGVSKPLAAQLIAIGILVVVISGYRPRWTCIPHWYVAYSMSVSITLPAGGDLVAQIATMLLIPSCLGDERGWQWKRPQHALTPRWRGAAAASHVAIRVQASVIYLTAGLSKLTVPQWRDGTAMFTLAYDPNYGLPQAVLRMVEPAFRWYIVVAGLTWTVIAFEVLIGVFVLGQRRLRLLALHLGIVLHSGIILLMGLPSFGLTMIALLVLTYAGTQKRQGTLSETGDPSAYQTQVTKHSQGALERDRHSVLPTG